MTSVVRPYSNSNAESMPARARTAPANYNGGFMKLVMRKRDDDDDDDERLEFFQPDKKLTQQEQDDEDEKARKKAMRNLVNSWQERLQLISVITTFFASTEAAMLVNTKPASTEESENKILKAANATLLGALILHVYAAVLSFLAAFLLIRYKLKEATREELIAEGIKMVSSPLEGSLRVRDVERDPGSPDTQTTTPTYPGAEKPVPNRQDSQPQMRMGSVPVEPPILSKNPHLEQVQIGSSGLLNRLHTLCIVIAAVGFLLLIAGIILYAWALQPVAVSVFATTCLGAAVLTMGILLV
ncbi:hypothetical protein F5I97DRAFT_1903392 [Phlebopus sp. FC_14]|nr:hypothetical protein F5I97DRAFT_1903392 [Phlebopus sp. FC_14]